jgi:hypothetical protein
MLMDPIVELAKLWAKALVKLVALNKDYSKSSIKER